MKKPEEISPEVVLAAVVLLSLMPFAAVALFPSLLYRIMDVASYLIFHNIAEFFSIMVSLSIFGVAWFTFEQSKNRHALFLGCAFLAVGLMDFMHTLGYPGMPAFITQNSPLKSTQFWIAVRLYSAIAFLISGYVHPGSSGRLLYKWFLFSSAVAVPGLVFTVVTFFPSYLPATFIEGQGLTNFKIYSEYIIIALIAFALPPYWRRYAETGRQQFLYYMAAFIITIFSELAFTGYKSAFDTYNALGHIYKIIAFALIYQGIFIAAVKHPYIEMARESEERKKAEDTLRFQNIILSTQQEASIDGILVVDDKGTMVSFNRRFVEMWGIPPEVVASRSDEAALQSVLDRLVAPEEFLRKVQHLYEHRTETSLDEIPLKDGRMFDRYSAPMFGNDGAHYGRVWYFRDITERRQAEEALKRLNDDLEQKVKERTAELENKIIEIERLNDIFVGRELKMVELKERIKELEGQAASSKQQGASIKDNN